jgi:hypothetical protein
MVRSGDSRTLRLSSSRALAQTQRQGFLKVSTAYRKTVFNGMPQHHFLDFDLKICAYTCPK